MSYYSDNDETMDSEQGGGDEGLQTMSVLSTLGGSGGEEPLPEGEALGLDPEAGKAKLSGSSLAVGVVVVLGAVTLLGMKMTLGAISGGEDQTEAEAAISGFIAMHEAAAQAGAEGPIRSPDQQTEQVLSELHADPTDHQVPPEEVESNPFDISGLIAREETPDNTDATPVIHSGPSEEDLRREAEERAARARDQLTINAIAGDIVYINGDQCRVGQPVGNSGFILESIDGLSVILQTTDRFQILVRLNYR